MRKECRQFGGRLYKITGSVSNGNRIIGICRDCVPVHYGGNFLVRTPIFNLDFFSFDLILKKMKKKKKKKKKEEEEEERRKEAKVEQREEEEKKFAFVLALLYFVLFWGFVSPPCLLSLSLLVEVSFSNYEQTIQFIVTTAHQQEEATTTTTTTTTTTSS